MKMGCWPCGNSQLNHECMTWRKHPGWLEYQIAHRRMPLLARILFGTILPWKYYDASCKYYCRTDWNVNSDHGDLLGSQTSHHQPDPDRSRTRRNSLSIDENEKFWIFSWDRWIVFASTCRGHYGWSLEADSFILVFLASLEFYLQLFSLVDCLVASWMLSSNRVDECHFVQKLVSFHFLHDRNDSVHSRVWVRGPRPKVPVSKGRNGMYVVTPRSDCQFYTLLSMSSTIPMEGHDVTIPV